MLDRLKKIIARKPSIGDLIANSIATRPDDWAITSRSGVWPCVWRYENAAMGWKLTIYQTVLGTLTAAFNLCSLTRRDQRSVARAVSNWERLRRDARRSEALRTMIKQAA